MDQRNMMILPFFSKSFGECEIPELEPHEQRWTNSLKAQE